MSHLHPPNCQGENELLFWIRIMSGQLGKIYSQETDLESSFSFPQMHVYVNQGWHFPKGGKCGYSAMEFHNSESQRERFFLFSFLLIFLTSLMRKSPLGTSTSYYFCNICWSLFLTERECRSQAQGLGTQQLELYHRVLFWWNLLFWLLSNDSKRILCFKWKWYEVSF